MAFFQKIKLIWHFVFHSTFSPKDLSANVDPLSRSRLILTSPRYLISHSICSYYREIDEEFSIFCFFFLFGKNRIDLVASRFERDKREWKKEVRLSYFMGVDDVRDSTHKKKFTEGFRGPRTEKEKLDTEDKDSSVLLFIIFLSVSFGKFCRCFLSEHDRGKFLIFYAFGHGAGIQRRSNKVK